jgi:endonuclease-3
MEILNRLQLLYPDAGTMLNYSSLFELLVAVILSAQSTDDQVNRVAATLFAVAHTPQEIASMELPELEKLIRGVGLYRGKAKSIKQTAMILLEKYQGLVPADLVQLMELPGVGRKTANVMLSVGFHQPGLGVDTHVQRVSNRLGLVRLKNADRIELALKAIIPRECWSRAHHLFIFHGRQICTARQAKCNQCVLEDICCKVIK